MTTNDDIKINATVKMHQLQFKVYPEKRVPAQNNWDTYITFYLLDCTSKEIKHKFTNISTNSTGYGIVDLTSQVVMEGQYGVAIEGVSHLTKYFGCYNLVGQVLYLDLTTDHRFLLAGEISRSYDNYINALDISVLIRHLYSSNYQNDLNQDGQVNSLDDSIQITNLYKYGD